MTKTESPNDEVLTIKSKNPFKKLQSFVFCHPRASTLKYSTTEDNLVLKNRKHKDLLESTPVINGHKKGWLAMN